VIERNSFYFLSDFLIFFPSKMMSCDRGICPCYICRKKVTERFQFNGEASHCYTLVHDSLSLLEIRENPLSCQYVMPWMILVVLSPCSELCASQLLTFFSIVGDTPTNSNRSFIIGVYGVSLATDRSVPTLLCSRLLWVLIKDGHLHTVHLL